MEYKSKVQYISSWISLFLIEFAPLRKVRQTKKIFCFTIRSEIDIWRWQLANCYTASKKAVSFKYLRIEC